MALRNKRDNYIQYSDGFYIPPEDTRKNGKRHNCIQYSDGFYTPPENSREKQPLDFIRKETTCCLYSIAQETYVTRAYVASMYPPYRTTKPCEGRTYYTMGSKIESSNEQLNSDCIAVIIEKYNIYEETTSGQMHCVGSKHTELHNYLYSNGNLYSMDFCQWYQPDVPEGSYRCSEELCTNESHINIVKREIERVLSQQETNAPVLTKKRTPLNNPNNK